MKLPTEKGYDIESKFQPFEAEYLRLLQQSHRVSRSNPNNNNNRLQFELTVCLRLLIAPTFKCVRLFGCACMR